MISDEDAYPELFYKIQLLPKNPLLALRPDVKAWLKATQERLQPVVDRAMARAIEDIMVYGALQKTIDEYVEEAIKQIKP